MFSMNYNLRCFLHVGSLNEFSAYVGGLFLIVFKSGVEVVWKKNQAHDAKKHNEFKKDDEPQRLAKLHAFKSFVVKTTNCDEPIHRFNVYGCSKGVIIRLQVDRNVPLCIFLLPNEGLFRLGFLINTLCKESIQGRFRLRFLFRRFCCFR